MTSTVLLVLFFFFFWLQIKCEIINLVFFLHNYESDALFGRKLKKVHYIVISGSPNYMDWLHLERKVMLIHMLKSNKRAHLIPLTTNTFQLYITYRQILNNTKRNEKKNLLLWQRKKLCISCELFTIRTKSFFLKFRFLVGNNRKFF